MPEIQGQARDKAILERKLDELSDISSRLSSLANRLETANDKLSGTNESGPESEGAKDSGTYLGRLSDIIGGMEAQLHRLDGELNRLEEVV